MIKMSKSKSKLEDPFKYYGYNSSTGASPFQSNRISDARRSTAKYQAILMSEANEKIARVNKAYPKRKPTELYTPKKNKKYDPREIRVIKLKDAEFVDTRYKGKKVGSRVFNNEISAADVYKHIRHKQFKREGIRALYRNQKTDNRFDMLFT